MQQHAPLLYTVLRTAFYLPVSSKLYLYSALNSLRMLRIVAETGLYVYRVRKVVTLGYVFKRKECDSS